MQLARRLILEADARVTESIRWKTPTFTGHFPRLEGDGRLTRVMRFADVDEVELGADELQAVIRAWVETHQ